MDELTSQDYSIIFQALIISKLYHEGSFDNLTCEEHIERLLYNAEEIYGIQSTINKIMRLEEGSINE